MNNDTEYRNKIYITDDYERFSSIDGNRSIKDGRVKKIINSIKAVGYIPVPILVNEYYQIIDGQGRFEALKKLNQPVYYMKINGIGINECIYMNINQQNWSTDDYIESYASRGYKSFIYLQSLIRSYKKLFRSRVIAYAATGCTNCTHDIKHGTISISKESYDNANYALSWLISFKNIIDKIEGRNENFYFALLYCYKEHCIDNDRMLQKFNKYQYKLSVVGNLEQALRQVEMIYNFRQADKIYIEANYKIDMDYKKQEGRKKQLNQGGKQHEI